MNRRRRSDLDHLEDALQHIGVLKQHLDRGGLDDSLIRDAVSHRLEVAIDSVGKISRDVLDAEASEDWPKIVGMRNVIAHQYTELDAEILQNTIDNRLDGLIALIYRLHELASAAAIDQPRDVR